MMRIMLAGVKNLRIRKPAALQTCRLQPIDARQAYIQQDDIKMQFLCLLQNLFRIRSFAANRLAFLLRQQQHDAPADISLSWPMRMRNPSAYDKVALV
jgi:hypothetical protein